MNPAFETYKLRRFIKSQGTIFIFTSTGKNQFNEPNGESRTVGVNGVYHETQGHVTKKGDDAGTVKTKPDSMIMCSKEDSKNLQEGMTVEVGGKTYKVTDLRDVENFSVACDISLELVLK